MNKQNKLKYYRMQQELSQADVADKLSLSRQSISNWENNKTSPDLDSLRILSQLYKVSIDELLGNSPSKSNPSGPLSELNLEYVLLFIISAMFLFTFFINSPYGIIGAAILLLYNKARVKSKLIIIVCILTIIFNALHFTLFLLL